MHPEAFFSPASGSSGPLRPAACSDPASEPVGALANGEQLKREGQQLALDLAGDWVDGIVLEFRAWIAAQKAIGLRHITIEQFRSQAKSHPRSHKAWGALPRVLCKAGLIAPKLRDDGSQVTMKAASPKTHAHEIRVWLAR